MRWGTVLVFGFAGSAVLVFLVASILVSPSAPVAGGVLKFLGGLLALIGIASFVVERRSGDAPARPPPPDRSRPAGDLETEYAARINRVVKEAGAFDPDEAVADAVRRGYRMEAILIWRNATGANLRDALRFVEEVQRRIERG